VAGRTVKSASQINDKVRVTYVIHEFLARNANLLRQGGAEHHNLLVVGGDPEDFLNVAAHI
jgi:hypothetical protein